MFFVTWRGLGYLSFMVPFGMWALACFVWGVQDDRPMNFAILSSAVVVWFLGKKLNGDKQLGDGKPPHLVYGKPMQWFAVVPLVLFLLLLT